MHGTTWEGISQRVQKNEIQKSKVQIQSWVLDPSDSQPSLLTAGYIEMDFSVDSIQTQAVFLDELNTY